MAEGPILYRSGRALDSSGGGTLYPVSCATLYGTQEGVRIRQMAHSFSSSKGLEKDARWRGLLRVTPDRHDQVSEILEKIGRAEIVEPPETLRPAKNGRLMDVLPIIRTCAILSASGPDARGLPAHGIVPI